MRYKFDFSRSEAPEPKPEPLSRCCNAPILVNDDDVCTKCWHPTSPAQSKNHEGCPSPVGECVCEISRAGGAVKPDRDAFTIEVEPETDGRWIADISKYPGVMAYGSTFEEAVIKVLILYESANRAPDQQEGKPGKYPIDRPCSACSAGDTEMEYHDHQPPFRAEPDRDFISAEEFFKREYPDDSHRPSWIDLDGDMRTYEFTEAYLQAYREHVRGKQEHLGRDPEATRHECEHVENKDQQEGSQK